MHEKIVFQYNMTFFLQSSFSSHTVCLHNQSAACVLMTVAQKVELVHQLSGLIACCLLTA